MVITLFNVVLANKVILKQNYSDTQNNAIRYTSVVVKMVL